MELNKKTYIDGHLVNYSSSNGYPTIWYNSKNTCVHRYVYEKENGEIPKGHIIHHLDEDRNNFSIDNLELLSPSEHGKIHSLKNKLGHSNKGKLKIHSSGFCEGAKAVILYNEERELFFRSVTEAAKFLEVKRVDCVSRVLRGRRKSIKGWYCKYAK